MTPEEVCISLLSIQCQPRDKIEKAIDLFQKQIDQHKGKVSNELYNRMRKNNEFRISILKSILKDRSMA